MNSHSDNDKGYKSDRSGGDQYSSNRYSGSQYSGGSGNSQYSGGRFGGRNRGRMRLQCQLCGKNGHSVDRCWHRFDQSFTGIMANGGYNKDSDVNANIGVFDNGGMCTSCCCNSSEQTGVTTPQAHLTSTTSGHWVVDSGATHHVTPDGNKVSGSATYTGTGKLLVGNGNSLPIHNVGHASLVSSARMLEINDLFHVPSVTKNLLSVSKFAKDNNVFVEFHPKHCVVRDEVTGQVLLEGAEEAGLYHFREDCSKVASVDQQCREATKANSSVTRAVFPVITGASRLCQHTRSVNEVVPLADEVAESTQELYEDERVSEGAVRLNNSGREDGPTESEPQVTIHGVETEPEDEAVPEREGELPEVPGLLSTRGSQLQSIDQQEVSEEQHGSSLQHEGTSEERESSQ
ncbi:hypothetical protein GQ457_13G029640 [Hibiscus cannabinus]